MSQKILVVDDSRTVRTVVEWVFHGSPYQVIGVGTATEAMRALRTARPAAVLVDYTLPDQSGFDLIAEIRRDPLLRSTPVVMLGGTWAPFDEQRAAGVGADESLMKPFRTDALLEKVASAISRSAARPVQLTPDDLPAVPLPAPLAFGAPPEVSASAEPATGFRRVPVVPAAEGPFDPPAAAPAYRSPATDPVGLPPLLPIAVVVEPAEEELELVEEHDPSGSYEAPAAGSGGYGAAAAPAAGSAGPGASASGPVLAAGHDSRPATAVSGAGLPELEPLAMPAVHESAPAPRPAAIVPTTSASGSFAAAPPAVVAPLPAASPVAVDEDAIRAAVRDALPAIVKDVLAALLRQTIGSKVEQYAATKIDDFVERDLPELAERAIEARLAALYDAQG